MTPWEATQWCGFVLAMGVTAFILYALVLYAILMYRARFIPELREAQEAEPGVVTYKAGEVCETGEPRPVPLAPPQVRVHR